MRNPDLLLYAVHIVFWLSFWVTRTVLGRGSAKSAPVEGPAVEAAAPVTAPFSRTVLAFHMFGFFVLYFGIANTVIPRRVPEWFPGQRIVGTAVIVLGGLLLNWAVRSFHSWRFRAKLDEGHQLATGGPFAFLRHPIYMAMALLALGSAIWAPTPIVWAGFVLIAIGSDLRGRSEEKLLVQAFGDRYVEYCKHAKRFIPGVY